MRIAVDDLVQTFKGNGDAFENVVHDLVRVIGRSCGIDPIHVHWDYRTNVRDGGRDLVVKVGNPRVDKQFLPARPSIWSIKSGEEGVRPASLRNEILADNHPKIRSALSDGWAYVWCTVHPANQDRRDDMRAEAGRVADELGFERELIEFRWPEQLEGEINLYPNLISVHLPHVASVLTDVMSLRQWARELELTSGWVSFGGRDDVVLRVTQHFLGRARPNVLHIAGLSGIGKTRTVYESCRRSTELDGVFYVEQFERVSRQLYRYLEEEGRHVYLVIDETPLDQLDMIASRLGEFAARIRVVTIGPAVRQAAMTRDEILVLSEPDTDAGVLEVVRAAGAGIPDAVLRSIADQSGHDLRLALLLVKASQREPQFRGTPVVNIDGVWQRLMTLFTDEIGNPQEFRKFYEVLTASIDVGMTEDVGDEIVALANHFQYPVEHVRDAAKTSFRCGLGISTRRFFEASPRALAARLFAERVWPRIQDVFEPFFNALPDRLARRFLERCHDCSGPVREEVISRVGQFFLRALSSEDVTLLASRSASRLFQTWAEFDPGRGLGWLRRAVEHATSHQLLRLGGESDQSGGWHGRRQLVWLCQNLASFEEHLESCEAILFRLALHETELSIGNNSTAIWQSLFWPILAGTEVPFDQRLLILLRRLQTAKAEELPLLVGAAVACVEHRSVGWPSPPRIVGGRVVPPVWRPRTWGELGKLRREAGAQILDAIARLPHADLAVASRVVADRLDVFTAVGLLENLRTLFTLSKTEESIRRLLVAKLETEISSLCYRNKQQQASLHLQSLQNWLAEVSSSDLAAKVRDLTAQKYWAMPGSDEQAARYDRVACELIASPEMAQELSDWFTSSEAQSADSLGFHIGRLDNEGRFAEVVRDWLLVDSCRPVTLGYLNGVAAREGGLPEQWANTLEALAVNHPDAAAIAIGSADVSARGFERLLALLGQLPTPASRFLRPLGFGNWLRVVSNEQRMRTAKALVRLAEDGDPGAADVGVDLIRMWVHVDPTAFDQTLASLALDLARGMLGASRRRDVYNWQEVLRLLCPFFPRQVADLVVNSITQPGGLGTLGEGETLDLLTRAAAVDPSGVMEAIGNAINDDQRRVIFGLAVFPGLFDAIGLQHVAAWLEDHGREHLPLIARHFTSPYLNKAEEPVVPKLTEWLFREHETDDKAFEWFLMGRTSGSFRSEAETDPTLKRQKMQQFVTHKLRRVREWADYEIREEERQAAFFRELDEEDDRR